MKLLFVADPLESFKTHKDTRGLWEKVRLNFGSMKGHVPEGVGVPPSASQEPELSPVR